RGRKLLAELPHWLEAVYIQVTPLKPSSVGPSKLDALGAFFREAEVDGFPVIAGHCGALGSVLRALGVTAFDAGLATDEAFALGQRVGPRSPKPPSESKERGPGPRTYLHQIDRSVSAAEVGRLVTNPSIAGYLACRQPCHRFRAGTF